MTKRKPASELKDKAALRRVFPKTVRDRIAKDLAAIQKPKEKKPKDHGGK